MIISTPDSARKATDNTSPAKSWAERFVMECDEARMVKAAAKRRRRERDRARNSGKVVDREILDRIKSRQACIQSRLDEGYKWWGGYVAGTWQKAFVFEGLMSDRHPTLLKFVQKLHRAPGLLTGMDKAIMDGCDSKLLALDSPYTGFNSKMRGILRIDLDTVFASYGDLLDAIGDANVPLPNIVVGHVTDAGEVVRPHLYWILDKSVCWTDSARGGPVRYFQAVHRGLTHALLAAGADPGGLSNPIRGKNPLSPHWRHFVPHGEPYDLGDLAQYVDMDISTEALYRESAALAAPDGVATASGPVHSNEFFRSLQMEGFAAVERFKVAGTDEQEFAAYLAMKALEISSTRRRDEAHAKAIAARVASYVWTHYDPTKRQQARPGRGRLWHECEGLTLAERQAMGGKDVAERRREGTLERLIAASRTVSEDIWSVSQADLAKAAGVSLTTVKRHWRSIVLARLESAYQCIDKKRPASARGTHPAQAALSPRMAQPTDQQSRRTTHAPGSCRAEGRTGAIIPKFHTTHRAASGGAGAPQARRGGAARHGCLTLSVRAPEPSGGQHPSKVPPL